MFFFSPIMSAPTRYDIGSKQHVTCGLTAHSHNHEVPCKIITCSSRGIASHAKGGIGTCYMTKMESTNGCPYGSTVGRDRLSLRTFI